MAFDPSKFEESFKAEARERILALNQALLNLERDPAQKEHAETLMREAHSIKGSAMMMQYDGVSQIAHKMEDGFTRVLNENISVDKQHFDVLFRCLDTMELLLDRRLLEEKETVAGLCAEVTGLFGTGGKAPRGAGVSTESGVRQAPGKKAKGAGPGEAAPPAASAAPGGTIRVDIGKLDRLVNLSGELLISKIRLNELVKNISWRAESEHRADSWLCSLIRELKAADESIDSLTSRMQTEVMKVRMVPVSYLFDTFPRAMRDLAAEKKKEVELEIRGRDTELDKAIIDEMKDPIMHVLRNSVDHGIESPSERQKKGKARAGRIILNAFQKGSQVVIEVSDDGGGIDVGKVKDVAVKQGLVSREKADGMPEEQVFQFLLAPGFSTKETVTDVSGRGVGLDVVRDKVAKCKGMLDIASEPGAGTRITLRLPLTLAITECLMVASGDDVFAIPIDTIVETVRMEPSQIRTVETKQVITVRGQILPLVKLHEVFGLPARGILEKKFFPVIIVQSVEKRMGFLVDRLLGRQEIVSKSIGPPLDKIRNIAGATVLGNGRLVLILDIPSLVESAEDAGAKRGAPRATRPVERKRKKVILLAEDVPTTAALEKSVLESAGYSVVTARDGKEALEKASREKFDLVIADIMMPRMNGFELTENLKKDDHYREVPVVIVTSRENDEDKRRGLDAGAEAYMLKSEFTSEGLLDVIDRLIG